MDPYPDLVDAMFARHGVSGPWEPLPATGLANRIYASRDVVLRVATDHPEAIVDARTESVAAPAAYAAGIQTPRLIAFDDSRALVDRPYSLWERVHGETFGLADFDGATLASVWRAVGRELSRLHHRVTACPDPCGYLDAPSREPDLDSLLEELASSNCVSGDTAKEIERLIVELRSRLDPGVETRFVHNDVHAMNIMCASTGALLGLIDWGDAGWGDPTLDFAAIPLDAIRYALEGYASHTPRALGSSPEVRIAWDKLYEMMEEARLRPGHPLPLHALREFLRDVSKD